MADVCSVANFEGLLTLNGHMLTYGTYEPNQMKYICSCYHRVTLFVM